MARKINVKLILELRESGLSRSSIASTRHISRHSVSEVFAQAEKLGIRYSDVSDLGENEVYRMFYPEKHVYENMYGDPNYENIHQELKKVGVTLKLLHEEYVERCEKNHEIPMGKTKFNEGYAEYTLANQLTNHLTHKPGERVEVDWSGPMMQYVDQTSGEVISVYLFVATLPYSQYSYLEPCLDMKMDTFIRCHIHLFEAIEGVPLRTVCDNLKTGVIKHPKEGEIILTPEYEALGSHYVTAILPTGIKKPKQKPSVEGTVGKIATAVIARCRNKVFYSFTALKASAAKALDEFNHAPFQKREGSRYEVWLEEKKDLRPLPSCPYEIAEWVYGGSVNLDFHVVYQKNRYSCPYQYAKKKVDLKVTDQKLEIYYQSERLTTHTRFPQYMKNKYSTHPEDMPSLFQNMVEWDDKRIVNWARSIGPSTQQVIERIFATVSIKEQGYNPGLAILRLSRTYTDARLEVACELALGRGIKSPRYRHLKAILSANQDLVYQEQFELSTAMEEESSFAYLRGSDYYRKEGRE